MESSPHGFSIMVLSRRAKLNSPRDEMLALCRHRRHSRCDGEARRVTNSLSHHAELEDRFGVGTRLYQAVPLEAAPLLAPAANTAQSSRIGPKTHPRAKTSMK